MSKEFTCQAECVDIRTGKRFVKGDIFTPPPSQEQALRLHKAGCLPAAAVKLAEKLENETATAAEKRAKAIEAAQGALEGARHNLAAAEASLSNVEEAEKVKATEARDAAKKVVADAEAGLAKVQQA